MLISCSRTLAAPSRRRSSCPTRASQISGQPRLLRWGLSARPGGGTGSWSGVVPSALAILPSTEIVRFRWRRSTWLIYVRSMSASYASCSGTGPLPCAWCARSVPRPQSGFCPRPVCSWRERTGSDAPVPFANARYRCPWAALSPIRGRFSYGTQNQFAGKDAVSGISDRPAMVRVVSSPCPAWASKNLQSPQRNAPVWLGAHFIIRSQDQRGRHCFDR